MTGSVMLIFDCTTDPGELPPDLAHEALQIHRHCTEPDCHPLRRARVHSNDRTHPPHRSGSPRPPPSYPPTVTASTTTINANTSTATPATTNAVT